MDQVFSQYWAQTLTVVIIAFLMAISPGSDFAMITRNSILYDRRAGIFSSLGIGLAIWIHVAYCVAGIAIIISRSIFIFSIVKYAGALYLIYLGWNTFRSKGEVAIGNDGTERFSISDFVAFKTGFLSNMLNPKATVFFLSLFTQVIKPDTPLFMQILYGAIISLAHIIWFSIVAVLLTQPAVLKKFNLYRKALERVIGMVLILFALKVALSEID